jgi:ubiquinone/menaquinone biosynthesis C-methylase UbiE
MEEQKRRQVEYHEREHYKSGVPREVDNSNPGIAWVNQYRIRKVISMIGVPVSGKSILCVCGGDGEEADFLEKLGAIVTTTDLSAVAIQAARLRNPRLRCLQADAESLCFEDRSFDWAIVRDGLHHLARPVKGLYELERVAREGFAILEGQDSLAVRLLVRMGLGDAWDPAGGYVYRFSRRELHKIFCSSHTVDRWRVHTAWLPFGSDVLKHFSAARLIYRMVDSRILLAILSSKTGRGTLKVLFRGLDSLTGRWGNSLTAVAWKKPDQPSHWMSMPAGRTGREVD